MLRSGERGSGRCVFRIRAVKVCLLETLKLFNALLVSIDHRGAFCTWKGTAWTYSSEPEDDNLKCSKFQVQNENKERARKSARGTHGNYDAPFRHGMMSCTLEMVEEEVSSGSVSAFEFPEFFVNVNFEIYVTGPQVWTRYSFPSRLYQDNYPYILQNHGNASSHSYFWSSKSARTIESSIVSGFRTNISIPHFTSVFPCHRRKVCPQL